MSGHGMLPEEDEEEISIRLRLRFRVPPTDEIDTIPISRAIILEELLKSLGGSAPMYDVCCSNNKYYGYIRVEVPETRGSAEMTELLGCSHGPFDTEAEAREKAAEVLISCLKRKFNFEVDDVNWSAKNQYDHDRFYLFRKVEELRKVNLFLKDAAESLRDGWAYTLQLADSVQGMAGIICSSVFCGFTMVLRGFSMVDFDERAKQVVAHTLTLKECAELTFSEGTRNLNRVLSRQM